MNLPEFVYTVLLKPPLLRLAANAAIKTLLPRTVTVGEAIVWINPSDPVVSGALTFGVYERDEISFFSSHFSRDMTLIDVGANVGLYTGIALSTRGFQGKILAIEPHGESCYFLRKTVERNRVTTQQSNIMVCDLAASDCTGTLGLHKNSQNKGDNRIYPHPLLEEQEVVATDTLDNICQHHGLESVHFLKVDVQGAEAKVISGASNILKRSTDCILMTEFWPYGLSLSGSDAMGYLEALSGLGFTLYELRKKNRGIIAIDNPRALISRTNGRKYRNLIGLKGRFAELNAKQAAAADAL